MKRRRFLQIAAGIAGATVAPTAFAFSNHEQEILLTIHERMLYAKEPIRVKAGERVRFYFVHAGGPDEVNFHLSGHRFHVVALDGNSVPTAAEVEVLSLVKG